MNRSSVHKDEFAQNTFAPDGYRYGVMFSDGSVAQRWCGDTQRQRAEAYRDEVLADQRAWLAKFSRSRREPDHITLARWRPGEPWERVVTPPGQSN